MVDFTNKQWAIIYIICFVAVFGVIFIKMYSKNIKKYLDENWRTVRCYPIVLPVAGLSDKADGKGFFEKTAKNFNMCASTFLHKFLSLFTAPLMALVGGITKGIGSIKSIIDRFRNMASVLRNMFAALVENTAKRMANSYGATIYLQEKLKTLMKKQSAMFEILKHFSATMPLLMYSFSHGPVPRFVNWLLSYVVILIIFIIICVACLVGGPFVKLFMCPICALCFEENTPIDLDNGQTKPIKEIKVGDKVKGATITGILRAIHNNWILYRYKDIVVSGDHLIYEDGEWDRIQNKHGAERVYSDCPVICLITDTNNLYVKNNKFRDYSECNDQDINQIVDYAVAKKCNDNQYYVKTDDDFKHGYWWVFEKDTLIKIGDSYAKISDIVDNDLSDDNIFGGVQLVDDELIMFDHNGIKVSGNTLYFNTEHNIWERIFQGSSKPIDEYDVKGKIFYNLITYDNTVSVLDKNGEIVKFRDFVESGDKELNDKVDELVKERLNVMNYD